MPYDRRGDWKHATFFSVQGSVVSTVREKEEKIENIAGA